MRTGIRLFYTALLLGALLACTTNMMSAMSMAPMPMKPREPQCTIAGRKQEDEREKRRLLRAKENKFINDLLTSHADLNNDIGYGKPLELVNRLKSIATLLQHGADPTQCQRSPLLHPLLYYISHVDNKEALDFSLDYSVYQQEEMRRDGLRRAIKLSTCWKLLLKAGANANQERQGRLPMQTLLFLEHDGYCSCIDIDSLLKLLIWHGANPGNIEQWSARNAYGYRMGMDSFYRLNIKQERRKYEAVRQILMCKKEGDSHFSCLPQEILNKIIRYVKHGRFAPPAEKKVVPLKVESIASVSVSGDTQQESKHDSDGLETYTEDSGKRRSTPYILRRMPIPIIIVSVAASGVAYWAYKKWKKHKKKPLRKQQLQAQWEQFQQEVQRESASSQML